ncbi:MAG: hypothetical protein XD73_0889 [Anaerolinea thermophila]|uniref:DUF4870 domain-containing protein n=1 Tax=Anaerolinea thermophila TaxID=167964 RepID=A0A101FXH2_9CHLR|nr:MAG: hypothetical protein XD73_0889 [Anaerolinea thermophila]
MEKSGQERPSDEKLLAGFAYLLGFVPAAIIWLLKRDQSSFIRFHALQAAIFTGIVSLFTALLLTAQIALMIVMGTGVFIGTNVIADTLEPESPTIYFTISIVMIIVILVGLSIIVLLVISLHLVNFIASVYAFAGKAWRYPLLGNWVERILLKDWALSKGQKI